MYRHTYLLELASAIIFHILVLYSYDIGTVLNLKKIIEKPTKKEKATYEKRKIYSHKYLSSCIVHRYLPYLLFTNTRG